MYITVPTYVNMVSPPEKPAPSPSTEEMWNNFIKEAPYVDGNAQAWSLPQDIPWFDRDRYLRGVRFTQEYFAMQSFILWLSSMVAASVKPIVSVFFRDFVLYPINGNIERDLKALKTWMGWIVEYDMTDITSQGTKGMRLARGAHAKYARMDAEHDLLPMPDHLIPEYCHQKAKEIREICQDIPIPLDVPADIVSWHPPVPFSQFILSLTTFGIFGPFFVMPNIYTHLTDEAKSALSDYLHATAVTCRMLGIQDKYNLALHEDPALYHKLKGLILIFMKEYDATCYFVLEHGLKLTRKFGFTFYVLLYSALEQTGGDYGRVWGKMNVGEKLMVGVINNWIKYYLKYRGFRVVMNIVFKIMWKIFSYVYIKGREEGNQLKKMNSMCSYYKSNRSEE